MIWFSMFVAKIEKKKIATQRSSVFEVFRLLLTKRFLTFRCVLCLKIEDTDDVSPLKARIPVMVELFPFHAAHA